MKISIPAFRGRIPRLSERILPDTNATIARDCDLRSGEIRPFKGSAEVTDLGSGDIGTIHRWFSGDSDYWLRFPGQVDVVNAPLVDDVYQRIYWTGDTRFNEPRMSYTPAIYTGGANLPATSYKWGVPAPVNAPTVAVAPPGIFVISSFHLERPMRVVTAIAHGFEDNEVVSFNVLNGEEGEGEVNLPDHLNGSEFQVRVIDDTSFELNFTDGVNVDYSPFTSGTVSSYDGIDVQDVRFYAFTYVTDLGEEGPPSPVSGEVRATNYQDPELDLGNVDVDAAEGRLITARRIYRAATGTTGGQFQFVAEIPAAQTEYTDTVRRLGETIPSVAYDPPPAGLKGIRTAAQGFVVGFYDNVVCFSEPYLPHAWPTDYQIALDYDVVAVEVIDNGVVVATTGRPYLIQGIEPRSMSPRRLELNYACVSARSMVSMGYAAVFASSEGLVYVGSGGARLLTQQMMTEKEWRAFQPETLQGYEVNGRYFGFYGTGFVTGAGFFIDPQDPELGLIDLSFWIKAGFRDPRDEHLYWLAANNHVLRWNDQSEPDEAYDWQGKVYSLPRPSNMSALKAVRRNAGTVTAEILADGESVHQSAVTAYDYQRLPGNYRANEYQIRLSGTGHLQQFDMAESVEELRQ